MGFRTMRLVMPLRLVDSNQDWSDGMDMKIKHAGLRRLYEANHSRGLDPRHVHRLRRILTALDQASYPREIERPGFRLHPLKGARRGQWSIRVSGNWRVVFRFVDGEAVDVDMIHYH